MTIGIHKVRTAGSEPYQIPIVALDHAPCPGTFFRSQLSTVAQQIAEAAGLGKI